MEQGANISVSQIESIRQVCNNPDLFLNTLVNNKIVTNDTFLNSAIKLYVRCVTDPNYCPNLRVLKWCLRTSTLIQLKEKYHRILSQKFWYLVDKEFMDIAQNDCFDCELMFYGKSISPPDKLLKAINQLEWLQNGNPNADDFNCREEILICYQNLIPFISHEMINKYKIQHQNFDSRNRHQVLDFAVWLGVRNYTIFNMGEMLFSCFVSDQEDEFTLVLRNMELSIMNSVV